MEILKAIEKLFEGNLETLSINLTMIPCSTDIPAT